MSQLLRLGALGAALGCAVTSVAAADTLVRPLSLFSAPHAAALRVHPPPYPPAPRVTITAADRLNAIAGGWQQVKAAAPFSNGGAGTALLMTDGTVMISNNESSWYSLTPDNTGNYVNGTWAKKASLPGGYGPLYFASAVLADGNVIMNGGEYNFVNGQYQQSETNLGAYYNALTDRWTAVAPPSGWGNIGDAQSVVLSNGTYMLGNCCGSSQALFNEQSGAWTATGTGKADGNSEEGWTLLASGGVLTADVGAEPNSELYNPATRAWKTAGKLPANLTQSFEIGPQMLRPDGTVFVAGANANTAVFNTATGTWSAGPSFPLIAGKQVDSADGPATLLTNGDVMMPVSPGVYSSPSYFIVFNGKSISQITGPPNAPNNSSYNYRLLLLPTGQVLETDSSNDVEIFTPNIKTNRSYAPTVSSVPATLTHGQTYSVSGKRFNGLSQANSYGDDAQAATNYPLVAITNKSTGHVVFARTHGHSSMAVGSKALVSTMFDVPATIETGASSFVVITNGIQSLPVTVTVN